jgi:hypothetical protein
MQERYNKGKIRYKNIPRSDVNETGTYKSG